MSKSSGLCVPCALIFAIGLVSIVVLAGFALYQWAMVPS